MNLYLILIVESELLLKIDDKIDECEMVSVGVNKMNIVNRYFNS